MGAVPFQSPLTLALGNSNCYNKSVGTYQTGRLKYIGLGEGALLESLLYMFLKLAQINYIFFGNKLYVYNLYPIQVLQQIKRKRKHVNVKQMKTY